MPERYGIGSKGILGRLNWALEQAFGKTWASKIGMYVPSTQEEETYKWLGQVAGMREWIGERLAKGIVSQGITLKNKPYEATLPVSVDDLRRDKIGQLVIRLADMARKAQGHWGSLISTLNAAGETTLCYDGKYFYAADHPAPRGGSVQKNLLTATEVAALDVTTAAAPTEAEMSLALLGVIGYMLTYKDEENDPMNEDASSFLVMVPHNLWGAAIAAANKATLNTGSGIVDNTLKNTDFKIEVAMNARYAASAVFEVFRPDKEVKPFIMQEEVGIKTSAIAEGSEHEFKNREHLYGVETSRAVGLGFWQLAARATLS